jgi:hypothetical protein
MRRQQRVGSVLKHGAYRTGRKTRTRIGGAA